MLSIGCTGKAHLWKKPSGVLFSTALGKTKIPGCGHRGYKGDESFTASPAVSSVGVCRTGSKTNIFQLISYFTSNPRLFRFSKLIKFRRKQTS